MTQPANWIAYDGECPFCSAYLQMVRLRDAVGPVALINVRENAAVYRVNAAIFRSKWLGSVVFRAEGGPALDAAGSQKNHGWLASF